MIRFPQHFFDHSLVICRGVLVIRHLRIDQTISRFEQRPQRFRLHPWNIQLHLRERSLFRNMKRKRITARAVDRLGNIFVSDTGEKACVGQPLRGGIELRARGKLACAQTGCGDYGRGGKALQARHFQIRDRMLRENRGGYTAYCG